MKDQLVNFKSDSEHTKVEINTLLQYALELRIEFLKHNIKERYHSAYGKLKEKEIVEAIAYKITHLVDKADSLKTAIDDTMEYIEKFLEVYDERNKTDVTKANDGETVG